MSASISRRSTDITGGRIRFWTIAATVVVATACHREVPPLPFEELTLERTVCYGSCPAYRITVFADGRVEYEGREFVKVAGTATKRLTASEIQQLRVELGKVNYFALRSRYSFARDGCPTVWTDNPAAITSVRRNGMVKSVHHYYGCRQQDRGSARGQPYPEYLTRFERRIDEIVGTTEWVVSKRDAAEIRSHPSS